MNEALKKPKPNFLFSVFSLITYLNPTAADLKPNLFVVAFNNENDHNDSDKIPPQGKAYSNMYGIYCLVIFFTTIIATYGALSEIVEHGATFKEVGLFIIVFYCMSLFFIICNEGHHASHHVNTMFQDRLLHVNLTAVDKETQKEVEMFLGAIDKNPPTINLKGYADINRGLITSVSHLRRL